MIYSYTVTTAMNGYLAHDVQTFSNKRVARQYATARANDLRESGESMEGNQTNGYYGPDYNVEITQKSHATKESRDQWCVDNSD